MKTIIYQVFPRLLGNTNATNKKNGTIEENGCGKFNEISDIVLAEIRDLGVSHMWYTGVIEHASATDYSKYGIVKDFQHVIKGKAGSPYAIKDYYDVAPDLAEEVPNRMKEFEALVERTHQAGMKVIIDFVPNHLARQYQSDAKPEGVVDFGADDDQSVAFSSKNNFYYLQKTYFVSPVKANSAEETWQEHPARVTGNDCWSPAPGIHDWYETIKLNYGVDRFEHGKWHFDPIPDTWLKMKEILLYWSAKGVDGFRCDMAEMVPLDFWKWVIKEVKQVYPQSCFIAEVYQPDLYHPFINEAGFDWLYDKVGVYDQLRAVIEGKAGAHALNGALKRNEKLNGQMLYFLENHDEQRIASDFFAGNAMKGWPGVVFSATVSSGAFMIYAGQELGEKGMDEEGFSGRDGRTTIFDYWSVDTLRRWVNNKRLEGSELTSEEVALRERYKRLLNLVQSENAFYEGGFYDLVWCNKDNSHFDPDTMYPFLRYKGSDVFIVVINFSGVSRDIKLKIPEHAFDVMNLKSDGYYKGKDVFDTRLKIQFPGRVAAVGGVGMKLAAYTGAMIKLAIK